MVKYWVDYFLKSYLNSNNYYKTRILKLINTYKYIKLLINQIKFTPKLNENMVNKIPNY